MNVGALNAQSRDNVGIANGDTLTLGHLRHGETGRK